MAELQYDPIRYLDLLEDYTSRETIRVRRNLAILSFSIIVVHCFDVSLTKLSIAGIPILEGNERLAVALALLLLTFWTTQFGARHWRDREVRAEHVRLVDELVEPIQRRHDRLSKKVAENEGLEKRYSADISTLKRFIDAYNRQRQRTAKAHTLLTVLQYMEWLPTALLTIAAAAVCVVRLS